jgi:hypothetical protein
MSWCWPTRRRFTPFPPDLAVARGAQQWRLRVDTGRSPWVSNVSPTSPMPAKLLNLTHTTSSAVTRYGSGSECRWAASVGGLMK